IYNSHTPTQISHRILLMTILPYRTTLFPYTTLFRSGKGIQDCARIVKKNMDAAGIKTQILPEKNGNPIVYGEVKSKSFSKTLLIDRKSTRLTPVTVASRMPSSA